MLAIKQISACKRFRPCWHESRDIRFETMYKVTVLAYFGKGFLLENYGSTTLWGGSAYVIADLSAEKRSDTLNYEEITNIAWGRLDFSEVKLNEFTDGKGLKLVSLDELLETKWRHFVEWVEFAHFNYSSTDLSRHKSSISSAIANFSQVVGIKVIRRNRLLTIGWLNFSNDDNSNLQYLFHF